MLYLVGYKLLLVWCDVWLLQHCWRDFRWDQILSFLFLSWKFLWDFYAFLKSNLNFSAVSITLIRSHGAPLKNMFFRLLFCALRIIYKFFFWHALMSLDFLWKMKFSSRHFIEIELRFNLLECSHFSSRNYLQQPRITA